MRGRLCHRHRGARGRPCKPLQPWEQGCSLLEQGSWRRLHPELWLPHGSRGADTGRTGLSSLLPRSEVKVSDTVRWRKGMGSRGNMLAPDICRLHQAGDPHPYPWWSGVCAVGWVEGSERDKRVSPGLTLQGQGELGGGHPCWAPCAQAPRALDSEDKAQEGSGVRSESSQGAWLPEAPGGTRSGAGGTRGQESGQKEGPPQSQELLRV